MNMKELAEILLSIGAMGERLEAKEREIIKLTAERGASYKNNQALVDAMTIDRRSIVALKEENEQNKRRLATLTAERNDEIEKSLDLSMQCERLTAERDALLKHEYICIKCGIRKDSEATKQGQQSPPF
jgi:superfamily II helicase